VDLFPAMESEIEFWRTPKFAGDRAELCRASQLDTLSARRGASWADEQTQAARHPLNGMFLHTKGEEGSRLGWFHLTCTADNPFDYCILRDLSVWADSC
jgi:hypothetical protein